MSSMTPATLSRSVMAIKPQSASTAITGTGFDTRGFEWAKVIVNTGAFTATGTLDVTVEESDALGSGYTAITGAVLAQITDATDDKVYVGQIDLRPRKRYMRVVATAATAACLFCVVVELSRPDTTDRVFMAQGGSEAAAAPLSETLGFSV